MPPLMRSPMTNTLETEEVSNAVKTLLHILWTCLSYLLSVLIKSMPTGSICTPIGTKFKCKAKHFIGLDAAVQSKIHIKREINNLNILWDIFYVQIVFTEIFVCSLNYRWTMERPYVGLSQKCLNPLGTSSKQAETPAGITTWLPVYLWLSKLCRCLS